MHLTLKQELTSSSVDTPSRQHALFSGGTSQVNHPGKMLEIMSLSATLSTGTALREQRPEDMDLHIISKCHNVDLLPKNVDWNYLK